jgi:DNA primase
MDPEIETVKRQNSILDLAEPHTKLRLAGRYYKGRCPFHEERTASFYVDTRSGRWRCFGRCASGWRDVIDFCGWLRYGERWNARDAEMFKDVFGELKGRAHFPIVVSRPALPEYKPVSKTRDVMLLLHRVAELYSLMLWANAGPDTPLTYLRGRGFSDESIRSLRLGYCSGRGLVPYLKRGNIPLQLARNMHLLNETRGDREFMTGRVIFPEIDETGNIVHLIGRRWAPFLSEAAVKYLSLKDFDKPIYGWGQLDKTESRRPVFVTESPPDRITLVQWGYDALATLGTDLSQQAIKLLISLRRPIVYLPHNDGGPGLRAARLWQTAAGHGTILELSMSVKDINELGVRPSGPAEFGRLIAPLITSL